MVDAVEAADAAQEALDTADAGDGQDQSQDGEDSTQAKATRMGWRADGGPLGAEEFLKRGEELAPLLKANNKALEKTVKEQNAKIAEMSKTLAEAKEFFSKTEERAYKAAVKDIEARLEVAVDAGDVAGAKAITKEATELAAEMKAPKATDPNADIVSARDAWITENPWFEADPDLRAFALGIGEQIKSTIEPLKQFAEIERRVKAAFPAKFTNARRAAPATVEGASQGRKPAAKVWADLPAENKAIADRFVKQGFLPNRQAYVDNFDWS